MKIPVCLLLPVLLMFTLPGFAQDNQRSKPDSADFYDDNYWGRKSLRTTSTVHKLDITYAFFAGSKGSKFKVSDLKNDAFPERWGPVAGGAIHFSFPAISKNLWLSLEANYAALNFIGTTESHKGNEILRKDYQFKLSAFQVPVTLRFNFNGVGNTFYLKAGYAFNRYNPGKLEWVDEIEVNREIITTVGTIDLKYTDQGVFQVGAGYKHALICTLNFYGELRYERAGDLLNLSVFGSGTSIQNLSFMVGVEF